MADEPTIRIRRPARVTTDERGRTVWADPVETAELELVSTNQLRTLLESTDDDTRSEIERVVASERDGVLARDTATGLFEIISDADLQAVLKNREPPPNPHLTPEAPDSNAADAAQEFSLVSTQVLRKVLAGDRAEKKAPGADKTDGFDPYNSS